MRRQENCAVSARHMSLSNPPLSNHPCLVQPVEHVILLLPSAVCCKLRWMEIECEMKQVERNAIHV